MSPRTPEETLLSTVGLSARARKLIIGTPMICEALRARAARTATVLAVLEAADTSENTHDKLTSKCAHYGVPHYRITATTERLAHAIGKSGLVAAVALTDEHLFRALKGHLPAPTPPTSNDGIRTESPAGEPSTD